MITSTPTRTETKKKKAAKKKKRPPKFTAKTADKHVLYQLSVQDPEVEIGLMKRVFKKLRGRQPVSLREDFCGTALMCAHWVKGNKERTAVGIDLDADVLQWGREHNLSPINEPGDRVKLLQQDVLKPVRGDFDIAVGFNFSYWIFRTRKDMVRYFKGVHRSLNKDGVFFLDAYGGPDGQQPVEEPRDVEGGFTYIWDQDHFDPIDNSVVNYIHFEFKDGSKMRKAFTYEWRFWSLIELQELLEEAGFSKVTVYWEGADADGDGNGVFRPRAHVEQETAWICYLVAEK